MFVSSPLVYLIFFDNFVCFCEFVWLIPGGEIDDLVRDSNSLGALLSREVGFVSIAAWRDWRIIPNLIEVVTVLVKLGENFCALLDEPIIS